MNIEVHARRIRHQMRMVLSDWYAWLARRSQRELDWLETPWWAKRVPAKLDLPWVLSGDMDRFRNPSMLKILLMTVEEVHLSAKEIDGLPDMSILVDVVTKAHEELPDE